MTLDDFFNTGGKIGVVGSLVYDPKNASDADVIAFHKKKFNFNVLMEGIHSFLEEQYDCEISKIDFHTTPFLGKKIWNPDKVPIHNPSFQGYYLVGDFFPSNSFLTKKFETLGEEYLGIIWQSFSYYITSMKSHDKNRFNKVDKDFKFLMKAAKTVEKKYHSINEVRKCYIRKFDSSVSMFQTNNEDYHSYQKEVNRLMIGFSDDVASSIQNFK